MRVCVLFTCCLTAFGCNSSTAPLVIGHVAAFSGADKEAAQQASNGIQLALDDYGATPSTPLHRPIVVRNADSKGDLAMVEGQAVRLGALNHALALLGGNDDADVARLDRAGVLVISPIGQRAAGMSDRVIVTGLSPAQRGKALASFLLDKIKPAEIVLLVEPGSDAAAAEAAFVAAWTDAKQPVPPRHTFGDASSDAFKKWAEALPKNAMPVVFASPSFLKTLALEAPLHERALAYAGPELMRQPLKDRAAPIYLVTAFGSQGKAAEFAKRYEAKFGAPAEPAAALAFDDTRLAIDSIGRNPLMLNRLRDDASAPKEFAVLGGTGKIASGTLERPAFAGTLTKGSFEDAK
jgi:ABC-type branched-subunit amino acid transport system substrate-binding protein